MKSQFFQRFSRYGFVESILWRSIVLVMGKIVLSGAEDPNISISIQWPVPGSVHPGGVAHLNYSLTDCPPNSFVTFHLDDVRVGGESGIFMCSPFMWHGMTSIEPGLHKAHFTLHVLGQAEPLAHASTYFEVVPSPGR